MKYALLLFLLLWPSLTIAEDRFWILWEKYRYVGADCPDGASCLVKREFSSRPLNAEDPASFYRMFGVMDPRGLAQPKTMEHPDAPEVCTNQSSELTVGFDPLAVPQSLKVEALRGIDTLHVDLRRLKAAPGHSSDFGEKLHIRFVDRLRRAGIKVVDAESITTVPGQPKLSIFFSFRDPEGNCRYEYSVFASLTQDVMLARDIRIKINAGVWSFSTGSTAKDHEGDERDAILSVADAFIRDHRQVNPR